MIIKMYKYGFTLAEVLVTLMIIGVIASMTVPALQNSFEVKRYQSDAQKAYAELSHAVLRMQNDGILASDYITQYIEADADVISDPNSFKNVFVKYFDVIKDCGAVSCVPSESPSTIYKNLGGGNTSTGFNKGQFVTKNGWFIALKPRINTNPSFLFIWVDLNGYNKKPNQLGRDLLQFQLMPNNTLLPMGAAGTVYAPSVYCDKTRTSEVYAGAACTKLLLEGDTNYW